MKLVGNYNELMIVTHKKIIDIHTKSPNIPKVIAIKLAVIYLSRYAINSPKKMRYKNTTIHKSPRSTRCQDTKEQYNHLAPSEIAWRCGQGNGEGSDLTL